jgi:hypothetical protein
MTQKSEEPIRDYSVLKINPDLSEDELADIKNIVDQFRDRLSFNPSQMGDTDVITHKVDTGTHAPVYDRWGTCYSQEEKRIIEENVKEMLDTGVIKRCQSNWNSNVVLVRKPDGRHRICINYRKVNDLTFGPLSVSSSENPGHSGFSKWLPILYNAGHERRILAVENGSRFKGQVIIQYS